MTDKGCIVKAVYENSHPPIWRRILLPSHISFEDFSEILRLSFELPNSIKQEYSFPYEITRIISKESAFREKGVSKDIIVASTAPFKEFLEDYKWTRVRLSDGKSLQVSLENSNAECVHRCARILKAKGVEVSDNWLAARNRELDNLALPQRNLKYEGGGKKHLFAKSLKTFAESLELFLKFKSGKYSEEDLERFNELNKKLGKNNTDEPEKGYVFVSDAEDKTGEALDKETDCLDRFFEELKDGSFDVEYIDRTPTSQVNDIIEEEDGQLLLPVYSEEKLGKIRKKDKELKTSFGFRICIGRSSHSQKDLIEYIATNHLRNYLRFMDVPNEGDRRDLVLRFSDVFKDKPQMICYLFSYDEGKDLKRMCGWNWDCTQEPTGHIRNVVQILISLGLAECSVKKGKKSSVLTVLLTKDLQQIVESVDYKRWKNIHKTLTENGDRILRLVSFYNVIESEELYSIYNEVYGLTEQGELQRITYWHLRMLDLLVTLTDKTNNCHYIALPGMDINHIMDYQLKELSPKLKLRHISREDLDVIHKGINAYYCCWNDLVEWALESISKEEINELLEKLLRAVLEGFDAGYCMAILEENIQPKSIWERVFNFYLLMEVFMETRLGILKWNSREEYYHITGEIPPNSHTETFDTEGLFSMSNDDQILLYHLWRDAQYHTIDPGKNVGHIEKKLLSLLKKYDYDYECCIAAVYILATLKKRREEIISILPSVKRFSEIRKKEIEILLDHTRETFNSFYEKARADYYFRDRYIVGRDGIDELKVDGEALLPPGVWLMTDNEVRGSYEEKEPIIYDNSNKPFVRSSKKIMPNDPCPCGSGKKYKKCCGRNK